MSDSPTYVRPTFLQHTEWELEAAKGEIASLQLAISALKVENNTLEEQVSAKDKENEQLMVEALETQKAVNEHQLNEVDYQNRISSLQEEVEQGAKELTDRIEYLENELKKSQEQLAIEETAIRVREQVLITKEKELEERERECERVKEFFATGNDVDGLVLDLQGRLKKQEQELELKEKQIVNLRVKLERAEQEKLAIQQTLQNQPPRKDPPPAAQFVPMPILRSSTLPSLLTKRQSLPPNRRKSTQPRPQRCNSIQQSRGEQNRIYDKPIPPTPEYRRLPFSLDWEAPYAIEPRQRIVNGVCVYGRKENKLYFSSVLQQEILAYKEDNKWETLPTCPHRYFCLAIVEDNVTAIGGKFQELTPSVTGKDTARLSYTDKLLSFVTSSDTRNSQWVELFPPMSMKRANASAVSTRRSLIIAGGDNGDYLRTVEVMDLSDKQWYLASLLPKALSHPSMVLCDTTQHIYIRGVDEQHGRQEVLYSCSISELLRSMEQVGREYEEEPFSDQSLARPTRVWNELPSTPNSSFTLAIINSQVMAVGGICKKGEVSNEIYYLDVSHSKWKHIAHMPTGRHGALVGFNASMKKLVIIGGFDRTSIVSTVDVGNLTSR